MRRPKVDPLAPIDAPTWFAVQNGCGQTLASRKLERMENLRAVLYLAAANRTAMGWEVEEMTPFCSGFFCKKDEVREHVLIMRIDPDNEGGHISPSKAHTSWVDNVVTLRRRT